MDKFYKYFVKWVGKNGKRFRRENMTEEQIVFSAFLEGQRYATNTQHSRWKTICPDCKKEVDPWIRCSCVDEK